MPCRVQSLAILFATLIWGCGASLSQGPKGTFDRYLTAIRTGDYQAAYAELSYDARGSLTYGEFAALAEANRSDIAETFRVEADAGPNRSPEPPRINPTLGVAEVETPAIGASSQVPQIALLEEHATGQSARGLRVLLNHTLQNGWSIDGGILGAAVMRTPRDALLALREALAARNWPGLLRALSRDERAESEADTQRLLRALSDLASLPIDASGDELVLELPESSRVRLVREQGGWRIREID